MPSSKLCLACPWHCDYIMLFALMWGWSLTVCPIPSTCIVALCTRLKPWPVTVIVRPPLWHTNTQRVESKPWQKNVKFTLICKYCGTPNNRETSLAYVIKVKQQLSATHMLCYWKDNSGEMLHIRRTLVWGFKSLTRPWNPQPSGMSLVLF